MSIIPAILLFMENDKRRQEEKDKIRDEENKRRREIEKKRQDELVNGKKRFKKI